MEESNANSRALVPELSVEENDIIRAWITLNIIPGKEPFNECRNSDLNGALCKRTGIRLSNEQFKSAMKVCGFSPVDETEQDWRYFISRYSADVQKHKQLYNYKLRDGIALGDVLFSRRLSLGQKGVFAVAFNCFPFDDEGFNASDFKDFTCDSLDTTVSHLAFLEECGYIARVNAV